VRPAAAKSKTRIFVVEDDPNLRKLLRHVFSGHDEFLWVDERADVTSDLTEAIRKAEADVVIMDVVFGPSLAYKTQSRIDAVRAVRGFFGRRIGIVIYTGWADLFESACLAAGADQYVDKSNPDALIDAIRNCKDHDAIVGLKIEDGRSVTLDVWHKGVAQPARVRLSNAADIAILHYLAHERLNSGVNWLARGGPGQPYHFRQENVWSAICRFHLTRAADRWESQDIARAAGNVNAAVRQQAQLASKIHLICVPGSGNREIGMYRLNEFIEPSSVALPSVPN
jgi:CheY-like chemotaxis protein